MGHVTYRIRSLASFRRGGPFRSNSYRWLTSKSCGRRRTHLSSQGSIPPIINERTHLSSQGLNPPNRMGRWGHDYEEKDMMGVGPIAPHPGDGWETLICLESAKEIKKL